MVFGLYGNYFLLLKEFVSSGPINEVTKKNSLKEFIGQKPQLGPGLLEKLEPMVLKCIHKGLTRHSIV